jgi:hypothetical protein
MFSIVASFLVAGETFPQSCYPAMVVLLPPVCTAVVWQRVSVPLGRRKAGLQYVTQFVGNLERGTFPPVYEYDDVRITSLS